MGPRAGGPTGRPPPSQFRSRSRGRRSTSFGSPRSCSHGMRSRLWPLALLTICCRHSYGGAQQDSIARVPDVLVHRSCPICNTPAESTHLDRAGRRSGCGRALTLRRSARARALSIAERSSSEWVWPREGTACSTAAFRTYPRSPVMVSVPLFSLGCARRSTTQRMPPPRGRASGTMSNGVSGAPRKRCSPAVKAPSRSRSWPACGPRLPVRRGHRLGRWR